MYIKDTITLEDNYLHNLEHVNYVMEEILNRKKKKEKQFNQTPI